MANEMTGLMEQIDSNFKKRGLDTTREGNNVTVQGLKKTPTVKSAKPATKPVKPTLSTDKQNADIFREGMQPPMDDDMGSAQPGQPGQPPKKHAKGGSVGSASKRADGIATKGKTRGTMVTMKNGGMC